MFTHLPPLKSLLAFVAASQRKNFSQAALDLYVSQSAISHQIKNLEQFLGVKLFYRQGNQLLLTDEGKTLASVVNPAFEQITNVTRLLKGHEEKTLQFGAVSAFAVHRLTGALSVLHERHPQLDLRLRMLTCADDLSRLDLDIILTESPFEHVAYECELLKKEGYFPVANAVLAKQLANVPVDQWPTTTRLIDIQGLDCWGPWFTDFAADLALSALPLSDLPLSDLPLREANDTTKGPAGCLSFSHTLLMLQAVLSGQGIALLGESLIVNELNMGTLQKLTPRPYYFSDQGYYFCYHKRRKMDNQIRLVKQWLLGLL